MVVRFELWLLRLLWARAAARGESFELPLGNVRLVAGPEVLRVCESAQDRREPGGAS